jgi:serine/threonine protein phosphatase 1
MIYVCSDIHAEFDLFIKLLNKIKFSKDDVMYICGDVIDKGGDSVKLMQFVMNSPNIHTIMGNHEYDFLKYYWSLMREVDGDYESVLQKLKDYFPFDGNLLDWDTVDFIEALPYYIETDSFILVHSGLPVDGNNCVVHPKGLKVESLVYDRVFKDCNLLPQTDKCIFFGHTPTSYICGSPKILAYKKDGMSGKSIYDYSKIHLDVGTWLSSGVMACFCVDTLEEFYVRK